MTDDEILEVVKTHEDRAVTAGEVAEVLDVTNAGALKRLNDLADRGLVERKKVGARAVVWWIEED